MGGGMRRRSQRVQEISSSDEERVIPLPRKRLQRPDDRRSKRTLNYDEYLATMAPPEPEPPKKSKKPAKAKQTRKRTRQRSPSSTESDSSDQSLEHVVPKKRQKRKNVKKDSSSDESSSNDSDFDYLSDENNVKKPKKKDSDEEESFVIEKILAVETHTAKEWARKVRTMQTHYIRDGSIFVPEEGDPEVDHTDNVVPIEKFLIKWRDLSYMHVSWQTEQELVEYEKNAKGKIQRFLEKRAYSYLEEGDEYFNPEYCTVDRVLAIQNSEVDSRNRPEYLVKWKGLGYEQSTWEQYDDFDEDKAVSAYYSFNAPEILTPRTRKASNFRPYGQKIPARFQNGMQLRDYQLAGLNWLLFNWYNNRNSLLADEMGLGKTVQTVTYINHLVTVENLRGPYIIIAPLSTLMHWQREFTNWTNLNAIVYHGNQEDRRILEQYEFYLPHPNDKSSFEKKKKGITYRFEVLITTYEMCVGTDQSKLAKIPWQVMAVDEAHRLKNRKSKLASILLANYSYKNLLLLTGTPLQNNIEELWTLLHFLDREKFASQDDFVELYGNLKDSEQVEKLQAELRPFLLRRMKEDVETSLAPKEETIIEVELTVLQKQYYRAIFERNTEFLVRGTKKSNMPSLMNIVMELRKCCNHPYLIQGAEERELARAHKENPNMTRDEVHEHLVQSCGKLILLDKLLPRLRDQGHRVLIFSQFKIMLDILEDYLRIRRYSHERIDGSITGNSRQAAIDRFCEPNSSAFIMLLSTRAGGVGINLTAADTCIIYDSDWNPQNDLQAQARCHRIGQTKSVKIYRLLSAKTYESHMFHQASMKLGLDQAVLGGIRQSKGKEAITVSKEDVENLLKFGAYEMLKDDGAEASKRFSEESVDDILKRSTVVVHDPKKSSEQTTAFSSFSKATFVSSADPNEQVALDDPDFWTKVIGLNAVEEKTAEEKTPEKRRCKGRYSNYFEEGSDGEYTQKRKRGRKLKTDQDEFTIDDIPQSPSTEEDDDDLVEIKPVNTIKNIKIQPFGQAMLLYGYGRWTEIRNMLPGMSNHTEDQIKALALAYVAHLVRVSAETTNPAVARMFCQRYSFIVDILTDLHAKLHPDDKHLQPPPLFDILEIPMPADFSSIVRMETVSKLALTKLQQLESLHILNSFVKAKLTPIPEFISLLNELESISTVAPEPQTPEECLERLRMLNIIRTLPSLSNWEGCPWWTTPMDDLRLLIGIYRHGWLRGKTSLTALQMDHQLFPVARRGETQALVWPQVSGLTKRFRLLLRLWAYDIKVPQLRVDLDSTKALLTMSVGQQLVWLQLLERRTRFMNLIMEYGIPDTRTCSTVQEQREKWRYFLGDQTLGLRGMMPLELFNEAVALERAARVVLKQERVSLVPGPSLLGGMRDQWILTSEQATRLIHRIDFFRMLRSDVLVLRPQDLHTTMLQVTLTTDYAKINTPSWWRSPDCDILLMQGVECYGLDGHVVDIWNLELFRRLNPHATHYPSSIWVENIVRHCANAVCQLRALQTQYKAERHRIVTETMLMMTHDPHHNDDAYSFMLFQKREAQKKGDFGSNEAMQNVPRSTAEMTARARVLMESQLRQSRDFNEPTKPRYEVADSDAKRLELEVKLRVEAESQMLMAAQAEAKRRESPTMMRAEKERFDKGPLVVGPRPLLPIMPSSAAMPKIPLFPVATTTVRVPMTVLTTLPPNPTIDPNRRRTPPATTPVMASTAPPPMNTIHIPMMPPTTVSLKTIPASRQAIATPSTSASGAPLNTQKSPLPTQQPPPAVVPPPATSHVEQQLKSVQPSVNQIHPSVKNAPNQTQQPLEQVHRTEQAVNPVEQANVPAMLQGNPTSPSANDAVNPSVVSMNPSNPVENQVAHVMDANQHPTQELVKTKQQRPSKKSSRRTSRGKRPTPEIIEIDDSD